ncbi:hypothetical protein IQ237_05580 [Sphaerospermopsis sp. LEGE 08334]|jgi:hypothetical protein|nr:hypothetical protein [Sphaerospermopsis sp. LEGE 08334]
MYYIWKTRYRFHIVTTPNAKFRVKMVTSIVVNITAVSVRGMRERFLMDDQRNVPIDTMIMTATKAAIGICLTQSCKNKIGFYRWGCL